MKTLLFTGGLGYIGSHNAIIFLEKGYDIIIIDNESNASVDVLEKIKRITGKKPLYYKVDLRNKQDIQKVFEKHTIDAVLHFAGAKAVGESCDDPFYYYENNINGSNNLFEVMNSFRVKNIIFSSSATVYSPGENLPFREDSRVGNTTNPYGTTKYIIENILRDLSIHKNYNVVNLRYFNPVGAHKSGLIGENPKDTPNNLLPYIMKVASGQLPHLNIYGDDYNTPDGSGVRDYIHVVDLAVGHLAALESFSNNQIAGSFTTYNLGTGSGSSVFEMIHFAQEACGKKIPYVIAPRRPGDIASAYCDPSKAQKELGWNAHISPSISVEDSWNFIKNNLGK